MMRIARILLLPLYFAAFSACSHGDGPDASGHAHHQVEQGKRGRVTYLGNEGLMVQRGAHKILFDPFFHNDFGFYQKVPDAIKQALMNNEAPYDDVNVLIISHAHGDHFAADEVLTYLQRYPKRTLVAPQQAIDQLNALRGADSVQNQLVPVALAFGQAPWSGEIDGLYLDAVRIPHAGWPGRKDVQNLVFRVRLAADATVMHMGDADPNVEHYLPFTGHWQAVRTDTAFPPYWFFRSLQGRDILNEYINADTHIGVHVPLEVPKWLEKYPYFNQPGELRSLSQTKADSKQ